jgi:hypothetical protein
MWALSGLKYSSFGHLKKFQFFVMAAILDTGRRWRTQFWKGTTLGWSPFKIVSVSAVMYPRWPPLQKIEISSNGQNCYILSQKVPTFELYKHNDELLNLCYRTFYELWTFAYFDRLCKLEKGFEEISIFCNGGHLGYRTALTDTILKGDHPRIISAEFGWDWLRSFRGEDLFLIPSDYAN